MNILQRSCFQKYLQTLAHIWCDFDRASSLICGNKMPTRCNRGFYSRSYYLLNMFRAQLCPSSGAQEYYTVVAACGISCCGFQVAGLVWSWGLRARFAGCCRILQPLYNTLELLMMGIMVPEICWASNKICNKKPLLHLVGILFPHINDHARSKSRQIWCLSTFKKFPLS